MLNTSVMENGDRLVRAEEIVETAHSTVNRLVFSRATKTIGPVAMKRSEKTAVHVIRRYRTRWRQLKNVCE